MVSTSNRTRRSRKEAIKENPIQSTKDGDGVAVDEEDILSDEVEDLIDDENEDEAIATLSDDEEDEDADVLAEADINTTKIEDD